VTTRFDLVVLGTGSAASTVASRCRQAGWTVAIVDSLPFGGTCALRGCDPKKVLVGAAESVDRAERLNEHGVRCGDARLEWRNAIRFTRGFTEPVPAQREKRYAEAGIATFHGRARFTGPTTVAVEDAILEAGHVVIATGAKPIELNVPGWDLLTTSDRFMELESLPSRVIFVGGGFIAFEFAHVAIRSGAAVTILEAGPRSLGPFDPDLVDLLVQRSRELGITVRVETEVVGIERRAGTTIVRVRQGAREAELEADLAVHGAGRVPDIDDLALEHAGVEREERRIRVNEYLQSVSNPQVYAAGDAAASGPPLTPVAGYDGRIVAANLLKGNHQTPDYSVVASAVFTVPPLASVGLLETQARERGLSFDVHHQRTDGWYSSRRLRETHSAFKVLVERDTRRILGAHLLGPHAEELINVFALAMRGGLTSDTLKSTMFAYPTHASDVAYMV
jgi:glutathione reductase (NADPH)